MDLNESEGELSRPPVGTTETSLPRVWAVFLLLLIGVTFPLWLDLAEIMGGTPSMPSVSLLGPSVTIPAAADVPILGGILVALGFIIAKPGRHRFAWALIAGLFAVAFLADQHRLQPWAYQSTLYAIVFASVPAGRVKAYLLFPAASVYVFSALGKLDYQFTHTVGLDFLSALVSPLSDDFAEWDIRLRSRLALLFPLTELCLGIGLVLPRTRRLAAVGIMLMHATLIGVLGPWSLGHSWGVLLWNVLLGIQAWLLFFRRPERDRPQREPSQPTRNRSPQVWIARVAIAIVLLAPLLERQGYWDHWLSWSLYSPHTSRVEVEIHRSSAEHLGPRAEAYLQPDQDNDGWQRLSLSDWSLAARNVPIYPQARYQLSLAIQLAREAAIDDGIRARVRSVSDRWSGERQQTRLLGRDELESFAERYWLIWSS